MDKINWHEHREKILQDVTVLPHFLRNPVRGMRTLPDWEWPTILVLQAVFAAACSLVANLLERDVFGMITALIVAPLTNGLMVGITCGFFFYVFMFFFHREIPYRQLYLNVVFASLPVTLVTTVSHVLPPLMLVGSAASLMLLFVGFVDNFKLPGRQVRNLLLGILTAHALYWGFQQVRSTSKHKILRQMATPESLDILEKELNP